MTSSAPAELPGVPYYSNPRPKRNPGFLAPRESGELLHLRQENRMLQRELIRAQERIRELEQQQQNHLTRTSIFEEEDEDNLSIEVVPSSVMSRSDRTTASSATSVISSSARTIPIANTTPLTNSSKKKKRTKRRGGRGIIGSNPMERITEIAQSLSNMSTTSDLTISTSMSSVQSSPEISDNGLNEASMYAIRSLLQNETEDDSREDEEEESMVSFESSLFGGI